MFHLANQHQTCRRNLARTTSCCTTGRSTMADGCRTSNWAMSPADVDGSLQFHMENHQLFLFFIAPSKTIEQYFQDHKDDVSCCFHMFSVFPDFELCLKSSSILDGSLVVLRTCSISVNLVQYHNTVQYYMYL